MPDCLEDYQGSETPPSLAASAKPQSRLDDADHGLAVWQNPMSLGVLIARFATLKVTWPGPTWIERTMEIGLRA